MKPHGLRSWGHSEDTFRQQNCFASDADLEFHGILTGTGRREPLEFAIIASLPLDLTWVTATDVSMTSGIVVLL